VPPLRSRHTRDGRARRRDGPRRRKPSVERLEGLLAFHHALLADARRNRAFHRALAARVRPGDSVIDIGAGTGIWAVAAARLGARRVVAVEREALLVPVIRRLAQENGVADRVEVVRTDARRLDLPREFDVVVSEMVGNQAFDEGIVALFARARERFLRPGGALIPERIALRASPVEVEALAPIGLRAASFDELAVHAPRIVDPARVRVLARSKELLRVDLRRALPGQPLPLARARFSLRDGRAVSGLSVWVDVELAPGVTLSTRAGTHWVPTLLPIEPLPRGRGILEVEVDWNPRRRRWRAHFEGPSSHSAELEYSPLFAWGSVRPASTNRRRQRRR
jgi:predicted RNA methylase